jgi:hypothetical protein
MEALRVLDQHDIEPVTFTLREPSLDDVFLALTGRVTESEPAEGSDGADGAERAVARAGARR